ncbi:peroxisome assembly protein 26-like [Glandiceps talaboti]
MSNELEVECFQEFRGVVEKGNTQLMFRHFSQVLQHCTDVITKAKQYQKLAERDRGGSENLLPYLSDLVESLCILIVQAYGETSQHQQVLPFLKECYHGIRHLPAKLIQICILLYGKFEDFETAEPVFREWKKFPPNQRLPAYPGILEVYILNILLPQMKCSEAIRLADSDTVVNIDRKIAIIKFVKKFENAVAQEKTTEQDGAGKDQQNEGKGVVFPKGFNASIQKLGQHLFSSIPFANFTFIKRLAVVAVFLYLILFKTNLDTVSGLAYASQLWRGIVRIWKSMFAPYHVASTSQQFGH